VDKIYLFAAHSGDFGKWIYTLNDEIKYGDSKGTTEKQMYLMGFLHALKDKKLSDEIEVYIPDEYVYNILTGTYGKKKGIISAYLDDIGWEIGTKNITYHFVSKESLERYPFYIAIQRIFRGRDKLYFDLDDKDATKFECQDSFNKGNTIEGYLCRISDIRYGMLYIEFVNGVYCPQWIWATPKIRYPFDKTGVYSKVDVDRIEMYEKTDGTNILAYIYEDKAGKQYVTYKTRLTPVVRDGTYGRFERMWRDILKVYPEIPKFCLDNGVNASFEMHGYRNPILIKYSFPLDAKLLFCRGHDGRIFPPSKYDLTKYGLKSAELYRVLESYDSFEAEYKKAEEELNQQLKVIEIEMGDDIVEGWEGMIWYNIRGEEILLLKCKPDYVRDIHFLASVGIPKNSIYITCINAFEEKDEPTLEYVLELLREEFEEQHIQKKIRTIENIYKMVYARMVLRAEVIGMYEAQPEFDIKKDKGTVMRYFSEKYPKKMMSRVYTLLWDEFGGS